MARELTPAAQTANAIRARLKREFSGVKFSVKSSNFSMGNSVDICWIDGPLCEEVEAITGQYQYRAIAPSLGCPGAKFVSCTRHLSRERREQIETVLRQHLSPFSDEDYFSPRQWAEAEKMLLGAKPVPVKKAKPEQKKPAPRNKYILACGCAVSRKADIHTCRDCGKQFCGRHIYQYADESNEAITKNSPELCRECYTARYSPRQRIKEVVPFGTAQSTRVVLRRRIQVCLARG